MSATVGEHSPALAVSMRDVPEYGRRVGTERVRASSEAVATAVGVVAGGLALAPLIATVLALTTPAVRQELSSAVAERRLTLFGMIGQFDGLESATGVVPLVVVLVAAAALICSAREWIE
jgi:hypothetical protein